MQPLWGHGILPADVKRCLNPLDVQAQTFHRGLTARDPSLGKCLVVLHYAQEAIDAVIHFPGVLKFKWILTG